MTATVNMQPSDGSTPSVVTYRDGTTVTPSSYPVAVPAKFVTDLLAAGWEIVPTSTQE